VAGNVAGILAESLPFSMFLPAGVLHEVGLLMVSYCSLSTTMVNSYMSGPPPIGRGCVVGRNRFPFFPNVRSRI